jgi:uncharacterized membrane protein
VIRGLILLALMAFPTDAQDLPALYPALFDVQGVAADDVLNIRARPSADAVVVGTLTPDAKGVEVVGAENGWAMVNSGEGTGYAKMDFLVAAGKADWRALKAPLSCFGTEPFWGLSFDPAAGKAEFTNYDEPSQTMAVTQLWPAPMWSPLSAIGLEGGTAVIRAEECSDGMSDFTFGIALDLFLTGGEARRYSGCCSLILR